MRSELHYLPVSLRLLLTNGDSKLRELLQLLFDLQWTSFHELLELPTDSGYEQLLLLQQLHRRHVFGFKQHLSALLAHLQDMHWIGNELYQLRQQRNWDHINSCWQSNIFAEWKLHVHLRQVRLFQKQQDWSGNERAVRHLLCLQLGQLLLDPMLILF